MLLFWTVISVFHIVTFEKELRIHSSSVHFNTVAEYHVCMCSLSCVCFIMHFSSSSSTSRTTDLGYVTIAVHASPFHTFS